MGMLARDAAKYQKAVQNYNRSVGTFNTDVNQYNSTIARDRSGKQLVMDKAGNVFAVDDKGDGQLFAKAGANMPGYIREPIEGTDYQKLHYPDNFKGRPTAPGEFSARRPDPTRAQMGREMARQSPIGLVNDVIRRPGIKY